MKKLAVIIHARLESTRVPKKHLIDIGGGNTLIDIALSNVSKLKNVNEKFLAVHESELKQKIIDGVKILERDYEAVKSGNSPHHIMYKHIEKVESDYILNYNPCQPFLNIDKVQSVIDWFIDSNYESAITVRQNKNFYWDASMNPLNFKKNDRLSTTSGPFVYEATHSLVFYKKEYMLKNWQLFSNTKNDPYPIVTDFTDTEIIDLDNQLDLKIIKSLYNENQH